MKAAAVFAGKYPVKIALLYSNVFVFSPMYSRLFAFQEFYVQTQAYLTYMLFWYYYTDFFKSM